MVFGFIITDIIVDITLKLLNKVKAENFVDLPLKIKWRGMIKNDSFGAADNRSYKPCFGRL